MQTTRSTSRAAAVYVRVSTSGQEEDGTSLVTQEERCRQFVAERGYSLSGSHIFREVYSGAELWERPELTRLREGMKRGEFQVIVAYAIDRLTRKQAHLGLLVSEAERAHVSLEFVTERLDTSPVGQFVASGMALVAEMEREKFRERSVRGKRARLDAGKVHNCAAEMYGYRRNKALGVREVYEPEATIVRRVFRLAAGGVSNRAIARQLNADGILPPAASKGVGKQGAAWLQATISHMLKEPSYKGETIVWRRRCTGKRGDRAWRPESEWMHLPEGTTPAIVSTEEWQAAQRRARFGPADRTRNERDPFLLRGRAFCGACGRKMYLAWGDGGPAYACSSFTSRPPCGAKRVPAAALDEWAWGTVRTILLDPDFIRRQMERQQQSGADTSLQADIGRLRQEIARLDRRAQRLVRAYSEAEEDTFDLTLLRDELARVKDDRSRLQATLDELEARETQQAEVAAQAAALSEYCQRIAANVDEVEFEERRRLVEAFGIRADAQGSGKRSPMVWTIRSEFNLDGGSVVLSHTRTCACSIAPSASSRWSDGASRRARPRPDGHDVQSRDAAAHPARTRHRAGRGAHRAALVPDGPLSGRSLPVASAPSVRLGTLPIGRGQLRPPAPMDAEHAYYRSVGSARSVVPSQVTL
jgi:site-specific DNA recombinase